MAGWESMPPMPTARTDLAAATDAQGRVYAIGGAGNSAMATVERYDPTTNAWTTIAPMPTARAGLGAAADNDGRIYAIAGLNADNTAYLSTVERFDPTSGAWSNPAPWPGVGRMNTAATADSQGRIYVAGGYRVEGLAQRLSDVWRYDPATDTWESRAPMPTARERLALAVDHLDRVYAIGGAGNSAMATVERYDPTTNTWTTVAPLSVARSGVGAASDDLGFIYVLGGGSKLLERYNPNTNVWETLDPAATARSSPGVTAAGFRVYTIGGLSSNVPVATAERYSYNNPPYAPTNLAPATNINKDGSQRFTWTFSDPEKSAGDLQSAYDLRYREQGAPTWTTVTGGATSYHDFTAGTFTAGDWEWQVRTTDNGGLTGPWSSSAFFTAAAAPAGPSITDPINNGTIDADPYTVRWTSSDQDAYQVRTVADSAGSPDTATVYQDTGTVTSSTARSRSMPFPVNGRTEHVQMRVQSAGLWSSWSSVSVSVSYTPPPTPTVALTLQPAGGYIVAGITNPAPAGTEPTVTSNEVWVRVAAGGRRDVDRTVGDDGIRIATGVANGGTYTDRAVASGVEYQYRAKAIGNNGVPAWSEWVGAGEAVEGFYGGGYE